MYGKKQRDDNYIKDLLDYINQVYPLNASSLTAANRGFYGETWRLETRDNSYFVKVDYSDQHKSVYRQSFTVIDYLKRHGADFIPGVVKTSGESLFAEYKSGVIGIFEWIDGEAAQDETTKILEYQMLAKIYTISPDRLSINRETFATSGADYYLLLKSRLALLKCNTAPVLIRILDEKSGLIRHYLERYSLFAGRCKTDRANFFITHGDAGGNILTKENKAYIIDWDEPKLAPPERDAWFCLHWDWAMNEFHDALKRQGIEYILQSARLAYYCYHSFFHYLTEYLTAFFDLPNIREELLQSIDEYFSGWIKNNLDYAEKIDLTR